MDNNSTETPELLLKQLTQDAHDSKRRLACAKLTEQARNSTLRKSIVKSGGIGTLVRTLSSRYQALRIGAAHALCNLANERDYHAEIVKNGAVKAFVKLLHDGSREGVCAGAVNLANLSRNSANIHIILTELGGVQILANLLRTWDHCSARDVCADLLVRLSAKTKSEMHFLMEDSINALVSIFIDDGLSIESREKVLTAMFNTLLNKAEKLKILVQAGAVPHVIKLLYHASPDGRFSALLMIKNLVVNGFEDEVVHSGGVIAVSRLMDADLHDLHYTEPLHFHKEVAKTLYELSVGRDDIKEVIIDTGIIPKLVPLLDHSSGKLKNASLKVLYGLAVNDNAKDVIIQAGVASKLIKLLSKNNKHAEFAATAVRNLAFDNEQIGSLLVKEGAVEALMIIIQCNESFDARKQALAAIVNLSNEPATRAPDTICNTGAIDVFCQEVLAFRESRKEDEFQWATWCAVVLHNLMEYDAFFEKVCNALLRHATNSPFKVKLSSFKAPDFKEWMADLAAVSDSDFL